MAEPFHGQADLPLGLRVHVAGGLVQNDHVCVGEEAPGDGQKLLLPFGDALVGEDGVVALGEGGDEAVDAGGLGSLHNLLPGGSRRAVGDVLGDGAAEEPGILEH